MPTLRLIYLTEHQYQHAFVTPAEDETNNTTIKDREQHTQSAQYSASASSSYDTLCNTKMGFDWNKIQCLNGDEKTAFKEMELFRDHNWRI